jgi:hypothetical protein
VIVLESHPGLAALFAAIWAILSCAIPLMRMNWRHSATCMLVLAGVPLLGWLTYLCGPALGVLILSLGLSILVWQPLDLLLRRRRRPSRQGAQ